MTIYTKQNLISDEKKGDSSVKIEVPEKNVSVVVNERFVRRRRLCLQFILLLGLIIGLSICVLGSIYLYKRQTAKRYNGWCGVKYLPTELEENVEMTTAAALYMDEEVSVDQDVETVNVPKFEDNDEATFVHDFSRNVTVIKDISDQVCYILPLDREHIPPPDTFIDLIMGLARGDYIPNAKKIREEYRVVEPAILPESMSEKFGDYIASHCQDVDTYSLTRMIRMETPAYASTTTVAEPIVRRFSMYPGGSYLLQYMINL